MKLLHISDLHLGKSIHGVALIDQGDQSYWVDQFISLCADIRPDAVLIAGDVYDRSSPSAEAVSLLDHMLTKIADLQIPVFMIAGNHDSGEKLSFAREILSRQDIHIVGRLEEELTSITLEDTYGPLHIWLMPYLFPSLIAQKLEDDSLRDYETAVRALLDRQNISSTERNVLIAHQNVTAQGQEVERGGSESMVGGVGQIDYHTFDAFDYVALGHIHSAYPVGRPEVRYAGSPLYYHFDELKQKEKGPLLVEMGAKGQPIHIEPQIIKPLHPMRVISGSWKQVEQEIEADGRRGEYLRIVITDQRVSPHISDKLHALIESRDSILMELVSDYREHRQIRHGKSTEEIAEQPIEELFEDYYKERMIDKLPSEQERQIMARTAVLTRAAIDAGKNDPDEKAILALLEYVMRQEDKR